MPNGGDAPRVWILKGAKIGDFAQMRALARALEYPFEVRNLSFHGFELLLHARPRPTLLAVDRRASDELRPPWPDLVLTAGRRNELPALWVKAEAKGRPRVVHIGRPWSDPRRFDLVISNRQYALDPAANVIVNTLPLVETLSAPDIERWGERFAGIRRPWTGVLVGGDSGPWVWTEARNAAFSEALAALIDRRGGSLIITTSARTPARLTRHLVWRFAKDGFVHDYASGAANPYRAILGLADRFVVTADSLSMLSEALATNLEVLIHDHLPNRHAWLDASAYQWKPIVHRLALRIGPRRMRRDPHALHRELRALGAVGNLAGVSSTETRAPNLHAADMARAVAAVRNLF